MIFGDRAAQSMHTRFARTNEAGQSPNELHKELCMSNVALRYLILVSFEINKEVELIIYKTTSEYNRETIGTIITIGKYSHLLQEPRYRKL